MIDGLFQNTRIAKGGTPLHPLPRVCKHERIHHHINNGSVSCYFYDAAGERTVKLTSETEMVHVNGKMVGGSDAVTKFTAYVSPYFVVSNGGGCIKTKKVAIYPLFNSLRLEWLFEKWKI